MSITLVTVHGTFAPKAAWAQPASPFCAAIADTLGRPLSVRPVDWSGHNTFQARLAAAATLMQTLESIPDDEDLLIVAHSHGGSVVHYAYSQRPELFERVGATVCMSTPFFGFSIRPGYESLIVAALCTLFVLLLQAALFIGMPLGHRLWPRFEESTAAVVGSGLLIVGALLVAAVKLFRIRGALYALLGRRAAQAESLDTTAIRVPRLTVVRSMGDEVAIGLTAAQFLCALTAGVLGRLASAAQHIVLRLSGLQSSLRGRLILLLLAALGTLAAALPAGFSLVFGSSPAYWVDLLWMWNRNISCMVCDIALADNLVRATLQAAIIVVLLLEFAAVGLLTLFAMSWLLSMLAMRGLGAWDPAGALTVQFAIEPAPEGGIAFVNAGWERSASALKSVGTALQHSNPYLSQAALGQIGSALSRGLGHRRGPAA